MKLNRDKLKENIEKRTGDDVKSCRVGGALVQVCQDGETVYRAAFGSKTPGAEDNLPYDTVFRMASMTKPITAAAILIQASKGLLEINDTVDKFIPEYSRMDIGKVEDGKVVRIGKAKEKIRILHLLTHSSGLGSMEVGDIQFAGMTPEQKKTLKGVVDYHANAALAFEPFSAQAYSATVAFDVMARIVEITSGLPYDRFLKKELFEPLGMKDTTFAPTAEQWDRMIGMHNLVDGRSVSRRMPDGCVFEDFPVTYFSGGAGLASTLDDYSAFAEMLLNKGNAGEKQIISPELIEMMATPQLPKSIMPDPQVWGLGVRVITHESYKILPVGAFGWSGAYGTHFWVDPVNKITAVYLKNSAYDGGSGALTAAHFEEDVTNSFED